MRSRASPSALERYLAHLRHERRLAANTTSAYARDGGLLLALANERPLDALGAQDIRRFIAVLHAKGRSPRSLARVLSSWRGFFAWLQRKREVAANPCACVRAPRMAKYLPQVLSPDDTVRLGSLEGQTPSGMRDRALLRLG